MTQLSGADLLAKYPIITDQMKADELRAILEACETVIASGVPGAVVEMGCYEGTTALFLQRLLQHEGQDRALHLYDSFAGLPPKTREDSSPAGEQFKAGELHASKSRLINNFRHAGLPVPNIHKAWFSDLAPDDLPDQIALAFLDGDFYDSIRDSLRLVWPKLSKNAVVLIDDYANLALPGARRAVNEWAKSHNLDVQSRASLAILKVY